ncbi:MAG: hypothetical protein ACI4AE_03655, partial [Candidatus Cryptobacteroides sp.]
MESTRICVLAPQPEYTPSGCYGHCGKSPWGELPMVAVSLKATEVERLGVGIANVSNIIDRKYPNQTGR